jgi:hypothetical protein
VTTRVKFSERCSGRTRDIEAIAELEALREEGGKS